MKDIQELGNSTDTVVGHLTVGEVVIPYEIASDPSIKKILKDIFKTYDASLNEFTVGNSENKINLDTGYPEFFFKWISNLFKGGGGRGGGSRQKDDKKKQEQQQQQQQQEWQSQIDAARLAAEAQRKKMEEEAAARQRELDIQLENTKAANIRKSAESNLQQKLQSAAENQKKLDQQVLGKFSQPSSSGYNIDSVKEQKAAMYGGGVSGPASTNAAQMGIPQVLASNDGSGGTYQPSNKFALPSFSGLQFGGV